jgi:hypothetical protein
LKFRSPTKSAVREPVGVKGKCHKDGIKNKGRSEEDENMLLKGSSFLHHNSLDRHIYVYFSKIVRWAYEN